MYKRAFKTGDPDDCRQLYRALDDFNRLCNEHNASYFAINETLVGAVVYGEFIPGSTCIEIGMLRQEYKKISDVGSFMTDCPDIDLHVFDAVPDDFDITRVLLACIRGLRKIEKRIGGQNRLTIEHIICNLASSYSDDCSRYVADIEHASFLLIPTLDVTTTKSVSMGLTAISIPYRTDSWIIENRKEELERTRQVQQDILTILCEIDRVCRENGIHYFMCGGTLLGAIRNGGFLPWDDDADIGMLRKDYDRFLMIAPRDLDSRFFLQTRESDPDAPYLYSKVRMEDTEYQTRYMLFHDLHSGISVDIFPFDYAPDDSNELACHAEQAMSIAQKHHRLAALRVSPDIPRRESRNTFELAAHLAMTARHSFARKRSLSKTQRNYERHVTQYNGKHETNTVASFVTSFTFMDVEDLLPLRSISFEGMKLSAPNHPEALLSMQYDDFSIEPPIHEQCGHNPVVLRTSRMNASISII